VREEKIPNQIFTKYTKGEIDRIKTIESLVSLIEKGEEINLRTKSIEFLGRIKSLEKDTLEKIENYMLSDISPQVRSAALKVILQNYLEPGLKSLKWVIKNDYSPLILKTILIVLEEFENEYQVILKEELIKKFCNLFGIFKQESRFFLDLYILLVKGNKYINVDEDWSKDYWPSDIIEIDDKFWIVVKNGHVQALNLNNFCLIILKENYK
jgi:hypothetical protein